MYPFPVAITAHSHKPKSLTSQRFTLLQLQEREVPKQASELKSKCWQEGALLRAPWGESVPLALASSRGFSHSLSCAPTTPVSSSVPTFPSLLSPPATSDTEHCDDSGSPTSHPGTPPHLKTFHLITRASPFDPGNERTSSEKARHQHPANHRQDAWSRIL